MTKGLSLTVPLDPYFDFQLEANGDGYDRYNLPERERDSDRWSPTLRDYHRVLWNKPLPSGPVFELQPASENRLTYLNGDNLLYLSSDRAVASFNSTPKLVEMIGGRADPRLVEFRRLSDTIGGIVLWPSKQINRKITINGHRGFSTYIADRLDLTLECVRRHYLGISSPLGETLGRYSDFFDLFLGFNGYINFFLLQDWVNDDYSSVRFVLPFSEFTTPGRPQNLAEYLCYMENTAELVRARNERIREYSQSNK